MIQGAGVAGAATGRGGGASGVAVGLVALLLLGLAPPALAGRPLFQKGPLCRDSKGLAKPCAPGEGERHKAKRADPDPAATPSPVASDAAPPAAPGAGQGSAGRAPGAGQAPEAPALAASAPSRRRSAGRPLFQKGPLCRDSKGLAKPCP